MAATQVALVSVRFVALVAPVNPFAAVLPLPSSSPFAVAFIVAGIAKGAIGMGMPPIAIGIMSFALPLESAVAIMIAPTMVTNVWQAVYGGGFGPLMRRFGTMAFAATVGILGIGLFFTTFGSARTAGWVGVILVLYSVLALTAWRPRMRCFCSLAPPPRACRRCRRNRARAAA